MADFKAAIINMLKKINENYDDNVWGLNIKYKKELNGTFIFSTME